MKRIYKSEKAEIYGKQISLEILNQASMKIDSVNPSLKNREICEREVIFYVNEFRILCETRSEVVYYKFYVDDNGVLQYSGYDGNFKG